jgi:hypothetical protein
LFAAAHSLLSANTSRGLLVLPALPWRLVQADYVNDLRRFRNTAYHFQPEGINDPRVRPFHTNEELLRWALNLSNAFRDFFARANEKGSTARAWANEGD